MTSSFPAEMRWGAGHSPLPAEWVLPEGQPLPRTAGDTPLDFCRHMRRLCTDITSRCAALNHIRMPRVLLSFTPSRNRNPFGLQARVTPMRFPAGDIRADRYRVQRYFVNDVEMLYLMTFCLPRFFNQPFEEKLSTVFHELLHISPAFDGTLRRAAGRVHLPSRAEYESNANDLMKQYRKGHDRPGLFAFLMERYRDLWLRHGGIRGVIVPRPRLLPSARRFGQRRRTMRDKPRVGV